MLKKILKKVYNTFRNVIYSFHTNKILKEIDNSSNIILIGSPLHGNIGDHAISIAEIELLKKSNKKIVEIPGVYYNLFTDKILNKVKDIDTIVITGGGFLGTLWQNEEEMVRSIVNNFKNNKVIIMPQTVYYEDSKLGKKELEKAKKIYNSHKNLYIYLRDENSYNFCKKEFSKAKEINLVSDIVTYLDYQNPRVEKIGALLCLRQDKEKVLNSEIIGKIENYFVKSGIDLRYTTTVIKKNINFKKRKNVFENKLNEFKSSKIVITDRLHGMIFAAITATPCIAFNNVSGKVKGVYRWLNHLDYISVVDDKNVDNILDLIKTKIELKNINYDNREIKKGLEKILENL